MYSDSCAAAYSGYRVRIHLIHALPRRAGKGGLLASVAAPTPRRPWQQVETVFCVGVMAACIIALAPPRSLRRVLAADVKEGIPRTACWLAHACPYPCMACLLAKTLTEHAAHAAHACTVVSCSSVRGAGKSAIFTHGRYRDAPQHRPAREMLRNTGESVITHLAGPSAHARGWASSRRDDQRRYTSSASGCRHCD
jgi:hypothetical protein